MSQPHPSQRCIKRLTGEIKKLHEEPVPNVLVRPDPDNMLIWYFVMYGLTSDEFKECPYEGGIYFGRIDIPSEYPFKPPSFKIHTPSGRFATDSLLCISISNFHPDQWSPAWSIGTAILGMITFMQDDEDTGMGSINLAGGPKGHYGKTCTTEDRKKFAQQSLQFNLTENSVVYSKDNHMKRWNEVFCELFPEFSDPNSDLSETVDKLMTSHAEK